MWLLFHATRTRNRRNTAARRRRIAPDEGVFRRNSAILRPHQSPAVTASPDRGKPSGTANFAIHPATLPLLKPSPLGGKVAATKGSRRMRGTDKQQQKVRPHQSPAVTDSPRPGEAFMRKIDFRAAARLHLEYHMPFYG